MTSDTRVLLWSQILRDADGNVSPQLKDKLANVLSLGLREGNFVDSIVTALSAKELTTFERSEYGTLHVRVVFEIVVKADMLSGYVTVHDGGCIAYLIDVGSSVALIIHSLTSDGSLETVPQAINVTYNAAAPKDCTLQIVNETTSMGGRIAIAKTKIWNLSTSRLVTSGTHTKMTPTAIRVKL